MPDSLGLFHWGPLVTLEPGRYRARAEMGRGMLPLGDPAEARGMVGFRPAGKPWGNEAWLLRGLEFNRSGKRTLEFTFHIKEAGAYGWVWRAAPGKTEFELINTRVDRETPLWSKPVDEREDGAGSVPLVLHALLAGALLVMAGTMGNRSARGQPESGVHYTWAGLGVYVLAGICLMTAGSAIGTDHSSSGWVFFSGMESFSAAWPPWLAAAVALAAAWAIGVSVGRAKVLLWVLPVAALGLWFGGLLAGPRSDFQIYYSAGLSLWGGVDPYAIRPERVLNPPPFVLATALFPLLPLTWSGFAWFGLKAAATVWCLFLARFALLPSATVSSVRWLLRPEWVALWISGRYVFMDLQYGNTNVLVLLSLLLLAAFWRGGRELGAGFASAGGTAVKLTPMLSVVTAALAGRIRWAVGAAVLSTAILLISAGVLEWRAEGAGMGFWRDVVSEIGSLEMGRVDNQSLRGFTLRAVAGAPIALTSVPSIPNLGLDQTAAKIAEAILAAGVLWLLLLLGRSAARGARGSRADGPVSGPGPLSESCCSHPVPGRSTMRCSICLSWFSWIGDSGVSGRRR